MVIRIFARAATLIGTIFIADGFVVKDTKSKYSGLKRDFLLKQNRVAS